MFTWSFWFSFLVEAQKACIIAVGISYQPSKLHGCGTTQNVLRNYESSSVDDQLSKTGI